MLYIKNYKFIEKFFWMEKAKSYSKISSYFILTAGCFICNNLIHLLNYPGLLYYTIIYWILGSNSTLKGESK